MSTRASTLSQGSTEGPDGERLAPRLTIALMAERLDSAPFTVSLDGVRKVVIGRSHAARPHADLEPGVLRLGLPDPFASSRHAELIRAGRGFLLLDAGSKNGTLVDGVACSRTRLHDGMIIEIGRTFLLFREASPVEPPAIAPVATALGLGTLLPSLAADVGRLVAVARSSASVLLLGETGTGKERFAQAVHALSGRKGKLVAINCAALPTELVEGELFGHRRGSFTSATSDATGLLAAADHGTVFLDEVGDLSLAAQASLLRTLQERDVRPVGATQARRLDIRLVTATHRDLAALVSRGSFREDFYARLQGLTVHLPPLRERREDLGRIISSILSRVAPGRTFRLTREAARAVLRHGFPRNIRELEKALEAAVPLVSDGAIDVIHLPPDLRAPATDEPPRDLEDTIDDDDQRRRALLIELLTEHAGNLSAVARSMGKARMQVHRWLTRYQIDPERFRR